MPSHIIAISSYGSQRVKPPFSTTRLSAYKIGYTGAGRAVLLALFGDLAQDVSPLQASYHYIHLKTEVTVRHGYLLLKLTDDELTRAEALTTKTQYASLYRWMNEAWYGFPNRTEPDYQALPARSGPSFNPNSLRIGTTAGEKEAPTPDKITAERKQGWWWLYGDTYPHRETLKRWGCRWSMRQKAWYYKGTELPDEVQALLAAPEDDAPCSDEEAAVILGVTLQPKPQPAIARLFALNQAVYARHDLLSPEAKHIPTGTRGTISRLYNRNETHGWSYDVDFEGIGTGWFFERELTDLEPVAGIRITRGAVVPPGADLPPTDAEVKAMLIENGLQPQPLESENPAQEPETPSIQIIKPEADDELRQTLREVKLKPVVAPSMKAGLVRIGQEIVGELTGSITGDVFCYGVATHDGVTVYVNMAGPKMAVEAIRAKFAKGEIVNLHRWDAPTLELTAGEGETGKYSSFFHNIPTARLTSLILVHEMVTQPNYGGKSTTFIFEANEAQVIGQLKHHITELVSVPVFEDWATYLWEAGRAAQLVRKAQGQGGLTVYAVDLDADAWTRILTGGLAQGIIALNTTAK